ncbi:MAG: MOSC N-terminal beta barrel domain-containing protein [Chloroflexota bacterium]
MSPLVSALYTYPIKSCGGLSHNSIMLTDMGPKYDRHWVLAEPDGMFITQREYPKMALIQPEIVEDAMIVRAPGMSELRIPLKRDRDLDLKQVTVWRDTVPAADEGNSAANWFSDFLNLDVRLLHMPGSTQRMVDSTYTDTPAQVGFADGYPILLISEASLTDLNERLAARGEPPRSMTNFRPNVVVSGNEQPFAEDTWTRFHINDVPFDAVKPCARCSITTVDPLTGEVPNPNEPLATLATFRKGKLGVNFGQNVIHRAVGTLQVGDKIQVKSP